MQGLPATSGVCRNSTLSEPSYPFHSLPPSIGTPPTSRSPRINPYLAFLTVTRSRFPSSRAVSFPLRHARLSLARAFFWLWSNSQHPSARSGLQSTSRTRHRRDPEDPSTSTNPPNSPTHLSSQNQSLFVNQKKKRNLPASQLNRARDFNKTKLPLHLDGIPFNGTRAHSSLWIPVFSSIVHAANGQTISTIF